MKKVVALLGNLNFALAILVTFLFIFSSHIVLPFPLGSIGRFHVLLLHLPIGFYVISLCLKIGGHYVDEIKQAHATTKLLLTLTATMAMVTAIFGLILANEPDAYELDSITTHGNFGYGFAMLCYLITVFIDKVSFYFQLALMLGGALLMTAAGHTGAVITHGEGFLLPGQASSSDQVFDENPLIYNMYILPILESKCFQCHNTRKAKNDLIMTDTASFLKGGKNGVSFAWGLADSSMMIQYALLPLDDELHMPPEGKKQLNSSEVELLRSWIDHAGSFSMRYFDLSDSNKLKMMIDETIGKPRSTAQKTYPQVKPGTLEKLAANYRSILPLCQSCNAIEVSYFLRNGYSANSLKDMEVVKDQLVKLSLANMPVTDDDLKLLSTFSNLEDLNLNMTNINGSGLVHLINLPSLTSLSLVNNELVNDLEPIFSKMPNLRRVFLDKTGVNEEQISKWRTKYPEIKIFSSPIDTTKLRLVAPTLVDNNSVIGEGDSIKLFHPIKGVIIHYSTNDEQLAKGVNQIYKTPITTNDGIKVTAFAIKEGWYNSDTVTFNIMKGGTPPSIVKLLTTPNAKYNTKKEAALNDGLRASVTNNADPNWLGFKEEVMKAIFSYDKKKAISKVGLSYSTAIPSYIFPPTELRVYGSNDKNYFKLIGSKKIPMINKSQLSLIRHEVEIIDLVKSDYQFYKVEVDNLVKIPNWHPGKGERGWLFIDEVFFYE